MIFELITEDEIAAAEKVFLPEGVHFNEQRKQVIKCLETKDIKAAPGSGKTTALLSKISFSLIVCHLKIKVESVY
ncbi:hypothetical protein [Neobacillus sp.]|uniref:hypothetical protein n=1 Tax=Neobacillus sp. TaxID=2675273 RepID=UPI00289C3884|nr:hypothetical protein [Neobacillus sp.]